MAIRNELTEEQFANLMKSMVPRLRAEIERQARERDEARADNERLLATLAQIEAMAAGAIHSKEAIHSVARGALNTWRNPKRLPAGGDEPTHERVAAVVAEVERLRWALEDGR
jgi:hypothetical protein